MSVLISNETVKQLFHIAQSIARENYNSTYGAPHLLQASVHQDIGLREFLQSIEKDPGYLYDWADVRIEDYPKTAHLPQEVEAADHVNEILSQADDIRIKLGLDEVTPVCVLASIVKPHVVYDSQELKSLPLREHEILNHYRGNKVNSQESGDDVLSSPSYEKQSFLHKQLLCGQDIGCCSGKTG